ncbi:MAG: MFS transporter [Thermoplasmata archaeon]
MDNNKKTFLNNTLFSIIVIAGMTISMRASNNMLITTVPLIAKYSLHFNNEIVGFLSAFFTLFSFLSSYFVNIKVTPVKRRYLFIISSFLYGITLPLFYFLNRVIIWILIPLGGFILGLIMPNIITSANLFDDKKIRERIIGIYTIALSVSLIIQPLVESAILNVYTLQDVFLWFTPFGIAAAVFSPFLQFPLSETNPLNVKVATNGGFLVAFFNVLTYNVPFAIITTFGAIYAKEKFGTSFSIDIGIFGIFFLLSLISRVVLTYVQPANLWKYMLSSMILTLLGLFTLVVSPSIIVYFLAFAILGIPHGLTYPLSLTTLSRTYDKKSINKANSTFYSVFSIIGIVTPLFGGIASVYIGLNYTFLSLIPFVFLIMLLARISYKKLEKDVI